MTLPTTEDMTKAREQAAHALGDAVEQARTPLLAALGAGDLAAQVVVETLHKIREQADSARTELAGDPIELRKRLDSYAQSAAQFYGYLADRGEETLGRLRAQPDSGQDRAEPQGEDGPSVGDEVLGSANRSDETSAKASKSTDAASSGHSASGSKSAGSKTAKGGKQSTPRTK